MGAVHESGADKVLESKAKGFGFNLNKFRLTARHCFTKSLPIVLTVLSSFGNKIFAIISTNILIAIK